MKISLKLFDSLISKIIAEREKQRFKKINICYLAKYEIIENNLLAKLIDIDTNFEYNLVDIMNTSYSALVNEEYEAITNEILLNSL